MRDFRYMDGATTLALDKDVCIGCGNCVGVCPHGVLHLDGDHGAKARIVDRDGCMECGACMTNCPVAAVRVLPGVGCAAYIISVWLARAGIRRKAGCC